MYWLLRMKRWAQNPPSLKMVKLGLAVILICVILVAIERIFGWPDALTVERIGRYPRL